MNLPPLKPRQSTLEEIDILDNNNNNNNYNNHNNNNIDNHHTISNNNKNNNRQTSFGGKVIPRDVTGGDTCDVTVPLLQQTSNNNNNNNISNNNSFDGINNDVNDIYSPEYNELRTDFFDIIDAG